MSLHQSNKLLSELGGREEGLSFGNEIDGISLSLWGSFYTVEKEYIQASLVGWLVDASWNSEIMVESIKV